MMDSPPTDERQDSRPQGHRQTLLLSLTIVVCLCAVVMLSRWMESAREPQANVAAVGDEQLYLTGGAARRLSLGFNGLVADWYWMRALQYMGRKVIAGGGIDADLRTLDLHLLAPLLDIATTLDPQFTAPYEYGAVILPAASERGSDEAIALLQKGVAANPSSWRLYHHLGYIYWKRGDYETASKIYGEGARAPGAPAWMEAMHARMTAEGGSRATAREMYTRMYEGSDDKQARLVAEFQLMRLNSLDERDAIRRVLNDYATRAGRCASSWRDVAPALRAARLRIDPSTGAPLDPSNARYLLVKGGCDVDVDWRTSKVPPS
jgi:tetratricopeptide (TPR) repeat protein